MRRRDLFTKLAAVTAAVALAPAAKAEAAPAYDASFGESGTLTFSGTGYTWAYAVMVYDKNRCLFSVTPDGKVSMPDDITDAEMLKAMQLMAGREPHDAIRDAYAEGYERGRAVRDAAHESRQLRAEGRGYNEFAYIRGAEGFRGIRWADA